MKKLVFLFVTLSLVLRINAQSTESITVQTKSEKVKTLVVTYEITYKKKPEHNDYLKALLLINGSKIIDIYYRADGFIEMDLSNNSNETIYSVFSNLKVLISRERVNNINSGIARVIIRRTNNQKQILGLNCDEYKMLSLFINDNTLRGVDYLYTYRKLKGYESNFSEWRGVLGIPLYWETRNWGSFYKPQFWEAKSISEQYVDSALFNIPTDYSIMRADEFNMSLSLDKDYSKEVNKEKVFGITDAESIAKWNKLYEILLQNASSNSIKLE
jgi:hypothetical protein